MTPEEQKRILEQANKVGSQASKKTNTPFKTIDVGILGTTPKPVKTVTPQTPALAPNVVTTDFPAQIDQAQKDVNTAQQEKSNAFKRARDLFTSLGGKEARQIELNKEQDLAGKRKTVTELNTQIQQLQTAREAIPLTIQDSIAGEGVTKGVSSVMQAGELRKNAIKQLSLQAASQAAQGNLAIAQDAVDTALTQEFGAREGELNALLKNIDLLKSEGTLSRADTKLADLKKSQLLDEKTKLEEAKTVKSDINDILIEAAQNGADAQTLNNITKAQTVEEAIISAGSSLAKSTGTKGLTVAERRQSLPLTPSELVSLRKEFPEIDIQAGDSILDVQKKQAEKFAEDNKDQNPEDVKKAINETTDLKAEDTQGIISKVFGSIKSFFTGGKEKDISQMTDKELQAEIDKLEGK